MSTETNPYQSPLASLEIDAEFLPSMSAAMRRVSRGLRLMVPGIVLLFVFVFISQLTMPWILTGVRRPWPLIVIGLGAFVGFLLRVAGCTLCLATPRQSGARNWARAVVWLTMMGFLLFPLAMWSADLAQQARIVLEFAAVVCLMFFVRRVSAFIGRPDIEVRAKQALKAAIVTLAMFACYLGVRLSPSEIAYVLFLGFAAMFFTFLGLVVTCTMAVSALHSLGKAIRTAIARHALDA